MSVLVWFRRDLRLSDHPALQAAVATKEAVIPVYIDAHAEDGSSALGAASRWWLHASLSALDEQLQELGSRLILRQGPALAQLQKLLAETKATGVFWHRSYEPQLLARDHKVQTALQAAGVAVTTFNGELMREPAAIQNGSGKPYRVFTPYWRACQVHSAVPAPTKRPRALLAPTAWPSSLKLERLQLKPKIRWDHGLEAAWTPGERGAQKLLGTFVKQRAATYVADRDIPSLAGTSSLSPHLAFGEISPRQLWHAFPATKAAIKPGASAGASGGGGAAFLRQLGWREFANHLLYHFPHTVQEPLRPEFKAFPWSPQKGALRRWQQGQTGFPIVDAGMRELWATGCMHNRVRMLVGSFLVKDLLIPWQDGAAWFWDTLVDADLANNTLGWQWISGCGADAAPYFRVFNPTTQGEKFDPAGVYVRRWVPELARLPAKWLHRPAEAPAAVLREAGVELGGNYPRPIVDHSTARELALLAYHRMPKAKDVQSGR